jgi:hypothetical protein
MARLSTGIQPGAGHAGERFAKSSVSVLGFAFVDAAQKTVMLHGYS